MPWFNWMPSEDFSTVFGDYNLASAEVSLGYWNGIRLRFYLYADQAGTGDLNDPETSKAISDSVSRILDTARQKFRVVSMNLIVENDSIAELVIEITAKEG